jgi:hypothetical protein
VYAPGEAFSLRYKSKGAALPLTLSLRDYATDTQVYKTYTLPGSEGTFNGVLPADLAHGYYGA